MNIGLAYFSQTGNTRKIAEAMAGAFREQGLTPRLMPIGDLKNEDIKGCDVLGLGAPCFESGAPAPVRNRLRRLPALYGKPAFVFATSGGAPGNVLYELARAVRAKGGKVMGGFMGRGTVHHPAPCLKGRMPDRPGRADLEAARSFALAVVRHLKSGNAGPMPESRPDALKATFGFYQLVGLIAKPFLLRILLPEPAANRDRCTRCGVCAQACPAGSITLAPYPAPGRACIRCYHCHNICPEKAFSEPWRYGNLVILALYNTIFTRLFGDIEPGERIY